MLNLTITNPTAPSRLAARVGAIRERLTDLRPLAERLHAALVEGLTRMAEAGTDAEGRPLAPLAPSTRKKPGQDAEPLQHNGRPAFLASMQLSVEQDRNGRILISVGFNHPAAKLTATGTKNQPPRNIFEPDAATLAEVNRVISEFMEQTLREDAYLNLEGGLMP